MKRIFGPVLVLAALLINLGFGHAAEAQVISSVPGPSTHLSELLLADLPAQPPASGSAPAPGPPIEQIRQKIDSSLKFKGGALPEGVSQKIEAKLKMAQQKAAAKLPAANEATSEAAGEATAAPTDSN